LSICLKRGVFLLARLLQSNADSNLARSLEDVLKPFGYTLFAACCGVACGGAPQVRDAAPVVADDGAVIHPGSYEDPFEHLGRAPGPGFVEILEVRAREDGKVFYCSGVQGLNVLDASNPSELRHLYQMQSSAGSSRYPRCQHLAWSGEIVYMTNKGDEVQPTPFVSAFDLSHLPEQEIARKVFPERPLAGIAAAGDYVYLAAHSEGLLILRRNTATFTEVGAATGLDNALGVEVVGTLAYVADGNGGLAVVDVESPAAPAVLGRVGVGGPAQSVAVDAETQTAWVAAGAAGLVGVDVSDPGAPSVVGSYDSPGSALQVSLGNGHAFIADWNDVRVVDISDRAAPRLVATDRIAAAGDLPRVLGVGALGNHAYVGEWKGLHAFQLHPDRLAPDLWVDTRAIEFGAIDPGTQDADVLIVENQGTARLVISSIEVTGSSAFEVGTEQLVLEPGRLAAIDVIFRPDSGDDEKGAIELTSDDPDEPVRKITVRGNRPGVGVGDAAPEIEVQLLSGGTWKLSEQRGQVVVLAYFATF